MTCLLFHVNSVEVPYLIKGPPVRSLYEICEEDSADADKAPLGERVPAARRCAEDERYILDHLQTIRQGPSPWLHSLLQAASNRG